MTEGLCQRGEELKMPIIATLLVMFLFVPAFAQEPDYEAYLERFGLLNECRPVVLDLILPDDAPRELAKRTRVATESRLRSARLLSADARSLLRVHVNVVDRAFSVNISYVKLMRDLETGLVGLAGFWSRGSTGVYGGVDVGFIVSSVAEKVDEFLADYLRINDAACGTRDD